MISTLLAIAGIFVLLIASEILWRKRLIRGEAARKLIHITTGTFIAFWPYFLSWATIYFVAGLFVAVIVLSRYFNVFRSIHSVTRKTWGELFFPVGIAVAAAFSKSEAIFMAAVLHISLADGLAGLVGQTYKRARTYVVFGSQKSLQGTLTFWLTSIAILLGFMMIETPLNMTTGLSIIIWLPLISTIIENSAPFGSDNVLVPAFIIVTLNILQAAT